MIAWQWEGQIYTWWNTGPLTHLPGFSPAMKYVYDCGFFSLNSVIYLQLCIKNGGLDTCRMESRVRQLSIWISYLNFLIWISLGQSFLSRISDLWVSILPFFLLVFSDFRDVSPGFVLMVNEFHYSLFNPVESPKGK